MKLLKYLAIGFGISIILTFTSFFYQRIGPIQGFIGTECGNLTHKCYAPVLNGGLPIPFIVDVPTITIPNHLNLDDDIDLFAFALDVLFYFILFVIITLVIVKRNISKQNITKGNGKYGEEV